MHADSEPADWQLQGGFLRLPAGHNGDSWVSSLISKRQSEMELPRYESFRSFLHIRSLEVCFRSSVFIRACKSINLCNALTGLLDWGWAHFTLGNVVEVPRFTAAVKKSPHFSLKKQRLSAKMAIIYLFGFIKSKDHMPIHCTWDLEKFILQVILWMT